MILDDGTIKMIKTVWAFSFFIIVIPTLLSFWWDVFYIRKNHAITSDLLFGKDNDYSTGNSKVWFVEASFIYWGGFCLALHLNKRPWKADKMREKAKKKGHTDYIIWPMITKNENYKKIVALNPKLMKLVRIRQWGMGIVAIASVIVINI